jgi:hypothetical protein
MSIMTWDPNLSRRKTGSLKSKKRPPARGQLERLRRRHETFTKEQK